VSEKAVRVRFAPSPTGLLHLGSARTALYNWAYARRHGGTFVLRVDDTDLERSTPENTAAILRALEWLGLDWDEGPEVDGPFGPYFQTARSCVYGEALEHLKARSSTYPCFCTPEELAGRRDAAREAGGFSGYDRRCRTLDPEESTRRVAAGDPHVWRLAVPPDRGDIAFVDAVRGETAFPSDSMDDLVLVRSDGSATYNFATVVDDASMGITTVIRGDDHLSNTPRQLLVFEALQAEPPVFAHMNLIWGPDNKRLSKRHGATSVEAYRDMGYVPDALLNYLAILGWSIDDKTTIVSREMLVEHFSLERISTNPAVFDKDKLEWMNGVYLREMPAEEFTSLMVAALVEESLTTVDDAAARPEWFADLAPVVVERVKRLDEIVPLVRFLFEDDVAIEEGALRKVLEKEGAGVSLDAAAEALSGVEPFTSAAIEEALRALPDELDMKARKVFQAIRVAASGTTVSPPLFESLALLGREKVLSRIASARAVAHD
jgi:glutamyl-tRNA synthetase